MPLQFVSGLFWMLAAGMPPVEGGPPATPCVADGWTIVQQCEFDPGWTPSATALASSTDGTVYVGLVPSDPRLASHPGRGVVSALRGGGVTRFSDGLGEVRGLVWANGTLVALHGSTLTALRDLDGDGVADDRVELVREIGSHPAARAIPEPVASGLCIGLDGRLYFGVDDRGVLEATGKDGSRVRIHGGGVVRVRIDGSRLEIVSTGERRPRSIAIDSSGELFTLGEADPTGRWTGGMTHHIDGGHYGYPFEFLTAPQRSLPLTGGGIGSGGALAICDAEGLPAAYQGQFFACLPKSQSVIRLELKRAGGTFSVARRATVIEHGAVADFHPVGIVPGTQGADFWIADAASPSSRSGRLYRLSYMSPSRPRPSATPRTDTLAERLTGLEHASLTVRLESQRIVASLGNEAVAPLRRRLEEPGGEPGKVHALWALDAIGTDEACAAVRARLRDASPRLRLQAARSCGLRCDRLAASELAALLADQNPSVRREAAIALGRLDDRAVLGRLMERLADSDRFAAWSIRVAIRRLGGPDEREMTAALTDPARREAALHLADGSASISVARALVNALGSTAEPAIRARMLAFLSSVFLTETAWTGEWWGPSPLTGTFPARKPSWSDEAREAVLRGMSIGLADRDPAVRFQAIDGIGQVGLPGAALLRDRIDREPDTRNQEAIVESLGRLKDPGAIKSLVTIVADSKRAEPVRAAALDALAPFRGPDVLRARFSLLYDPAVPASLVARALPPLARGGFLPANDLASFLEHPSPLVRSAAILSVNAAKAPPAEIRRLLLARLDDDSEEVRQAAVLASGALKLREAVPRLIEIATKPGDPLRPSAITALCQLPDPRAQEIYRSAGSDEDPSLRRAANRALAELRPARDAGTIPAGFTAGEASTAAERLRRFMLDHSGDPRKGQELFEKGKGACARCHGAGIRAPLDRDTTLTKPALVDALLRPRPPVAAAHQELGRLESLFTPLEFADLVTYLLGE